jgi:signal transduction histidine kinase/tetratricopeptide (TPR) repeat protein
MELFILDDVFAELEAWLAQTPPESVQAAHLLNLSWHLRQRDAERAIQFAAQARARSQPGQAGWFRLDLIEAEIALLKGDFATSQAQTSKAMDGLLAHGDDPVGLSDAHFLQVGLHLQAGRSLEALASLGLAGQYAQVAGDTLRSRVAELWADLVQAFRDPVAGKARGAPSEYEVATMPAGLSMWAHELQGTLAAQASDYGWAAAARMLAFEEGLQTGQIQRAIVAALNASAALNSLNEYELSLQWLDRALHLARTKAWPVYLANGLALMGENQRCLGRLEAARESLQESFGILAALPRGRGYTIVLKYLADLDLAQNMPQSAFERFVEVYERTQVDAQPDMAIYACRGQSQALAQLGHPAQAQALALQALDLAQSSGNIYRQVDALRALAGLHAKHPLPLPEGVDTPNVSLHFLQQAFSLTHDIQGYLVPGELWEELAEAHARGGDMLQAYTLLQRAAPAHRRIQSDAANKRLITMQVLQQAERARAQALAQRQAQAQRAQEERMASLARLVAGVAHELNTPLGNCLVVASTLQSGSARVATELQAQNLKRSEMVQFLEDAQYASDMLMRGLSRAAELVQRFKQIAVDRKSAILQQFDLLQLCEQCLADCNESLVQHRVQAHLVLPTGLHLYSYPEALQQLLAQLIENALQHAFGERSSGNLWLRASPQGGSMLRLEVCDDGKGIATEHLGQIFDPFFSTRFGQGGSGLGLHICHNLATNVLGGQLQVRSTVGAGSCFELVFPLQAQAFALASLPDTGLPK